MGPAFYFSRKTYFVDSKKCLTEAILISIQNYFPQEIRISTFFCCYCCWKSMFSRWGIILQPKCTDMKTYVTGTMRNATCFHGEIRKHTHRFSTKYFSSESTLNVIYKANAGGMINNDNAHWSKQSDLDLLFTLNIGSPKLLNKLLIFENIHFTTCKTARLHGK